MSDQTVIPLRPKQDDARTPHVWCHGCYREPVAFDWRRRLQLCADCEREPVLPGAA